MRLQQIITKYQTWKSFLECRRPPGKTLEHSQTAIRLKIQCQSGRNLSSLPQRRCGAGQKRMWGGRGRCDASDPHSLGIRHLREAPAIAIVIARAPRGCKEPFGMWRQQPVKSVPFTGEGLLSLNMLLCITGRLCTTPGGYKHWSSV